MYPKIYLAIDNCVLYKRWTRPAEWASVIADLGIKYIEASADTELDPLYMGKEYLRDWVGLVREAEVRCGVEVCNLFSGHGTYTTLGLTHTDHRVREHIITEWFFPMVHMAGELGCGIGFFAHAFNDDILQDSKLYYRYVDILIDSMARINLYAQEAGCEKLGIEQMYTPHQFPWRIKDTKMLIEAVTERSGRDFYFTEDVGHHHIKFMRPSKNDLENGLQRDHWFGTERAVRIAASEGFGGWERIRRDMDMNPQLFSSKEDGDCYETLRLLGCYSPIIHLQQTNGRSSAHLPFTEAENKNGIITGSKVLRALKEAYDRPVEKSMPRRTDKIYLTLELFSGTTSIMRDVLADYRESVEYWRRFVPEDGVELDKLADCAGQALYEQNKKRKGERRC